MLPRNHKSNLYPFSLPPETHIRYVMVLVAFLVFMWEMGLLVTDIIFGYEGRDAAVSLVQSLDQDIANLPVIFDIGEQFTQAQVTNLIQRQKISLRAFILISKAMLEGLVFPLFFVGVAIVYFLLHPIFLRHKYHLKELDKHQNSELVEAIHTLSKSVGILPPKLLIGGLSTDAQVFGFGNGYVIRLGYYLPKLYKEKLQAFQVTVLHELAHIVNGDVSRAYWTQGIWLSTLVASILFIATRFYIVLVLDWITIFDAIRMSVLTLFYLLILRVMMYNLLKIREHYADYRVASWGQGVQLAAILKQNYEIKRNTVFWLSALRNHPSEKERVEALEDTSRFFIMTSEFSLLSGILIGMLLSYSHALRNSGLDGLTTIFDFIHNFLFQHFIVRVGETVSLADSLVTDIINVGLSIIAGIFTSLGEFVAALLSVGIVGVQIQRFALLGLVGWHNFGKSILIQFRSAFFIAVGVEFGFVLNIFPMFGYYYLRGSYSPVEMYLLSVVVFSILIFFWMTFVRFLNLLFVGSYIGKKVPKFRSLIVGFFSLLMLWTFYEPFNFWRMLMVGSYVGYSSDLRYLAYEIAFALIAFVIFWSLFLAIAFLFKLRRIIFSTKCPSCHKQLKLTSIAIVRKKCDYCNLELSQWLNSRSNIP